MELGSLESSQNAIPARYTLSFVSKKIEGRERQAESRKFGAQS